MAKLDIKKTDLAFMSFSGSDEPSESGKPAEAPAPGQKAEPKESPQPQKAPEKKKPSPSMTQTTEKKPGLRKTRVGVVASTGMSKTITVVYIARVPHPRFKKIIKRSKKFYAHDEKEEAAVGDKVRIVETRPLSKLKRWKLEKILSH